ncbi:hypothetical protein P7D95_15645 [Enterococcus avium]|jgi:hypothetical protein|nr:hypothetical protein [Enterococcus avium]MDT2502237.1 hypothetical protein [Enterococcus avium]
MIKISLERGIKELKAYLIFGATGEEKKGVEKSIEVLQELKELADYSD